MTAFMKKLQTRIFVFSQILACKFGNKYLAALGHFENSSCQMIAKKFPNGDTTFFQKVNFHVKTTFDALILCLEFRRMFEI